MAANATSFMFPWSPSPTHTHTHTHGMFSLQMKFSRNGLCNGVKNKHTRPRWRPRDPTVPMVVGSSNDEAQVGVPIGGVGAGATLSRNGLGYLRSKVPQTPTFQLCVIRCVKKSHPSSLKVH
ncbi:hypothetical protein ACFX13_006465 [Malus domestica]